MVTSPGVAVGQVASSLAVLVLLTAAVNAFELYVPEYGKQCFYEELEKGVSVSGTFVVMEGGDGSVDFTVRGWSGRCRVRTCNSWLVEEEFFFPLPSYKHATTCLCRHRA